MASCHGPPNGDLLLVKEIDHNPHERRMTNGIWWVLAGILALSWIGYFLLRSPDWWSLALGGFTMGVLVTWAIEKTGNQVPDSWRR